MLFQILLNIVSLYGDRIRLTKSTTRLTSLSMALVVLLAVTVSACQDSGSSKAPGEVQADSSVRSGAGALPEEHTCPAVSNVRPTGTTLSDIPFDFTACKRDASNAKRIWIRSEADGSNHYEYCMIPLRWISDQNIEYIPDPKANVTNPEPEPYSVCTTGLEKGGELEFSTSKTFDAVAVTEKTLLPILKLCLKSKHYDTCPDFAIGKLPVAK